jgi:ribosomal protein S18 acetylase RimI-like enzyme
MFTYDKYITLSLDTKTVFSSIIGNIDPAIRLLTADDIEDYWLLRRRALRENPEAFALSYEEALNQSLDSLMHRFQAMNNHDNFVIGAFFDETLVGMVHVSRTNILKMRHKATLSETYVVPEARGRRLGYGLMKYAIDLSYHMEGVEQLQLSVATTNARARYLYHSLGFKVYGLERHGLKIGSTYLDGAHMVLFFN